MALHKISIHNQGSASARAERDGFSMIELLVVIGMVVVLGGLGLIVSMDFYKGYAFRSERNILVSVLEKARHQSLDNVNAQAHGVRVESDRYIIFQGSTYSAGASTNETIMAAQGITNNGGGTWTVVFNQLDGSVSTVPSQLTLSSDVKSMSININGEGQINW